MTGMGMGTDRETDKTDLNPHQSNATQRKPNHDFSFWETSWGTLDISIYFYCVLLCFRL